MTSNNNSKYFVLKKDGIACKTDIGLYYSQEYSKNIISPIFSIYGSVQQVRALFSLFSMGHELSLVNNDGESVVNLRRDRDILRFKGYSIGYGKQHGMVWNEQSTDKKVIYWFTPEEKQAALYTALQRRKIPIAKDWIPWIENLLEKEEYLIPLEGWGGIQGCLLDLYGDADDRMCDLICEKLKDK